MSRGLLLGCVLALSCAAAARVVTLHEPGILVAREVAQEPAVSLGLTQIDEVSVRRDVDRLAADDMQGRYSPGPGYERAARYVAAAFSDIGLEGAGPGGSFFLPVQRKVDVPDVKETALRRIAADERVTTFGLGSDFVPVPGCVGKANGPLVFVGFGVGDATDEFELGAWRAEWKGAIALCLEGEPAHATRFDGPAVSLAADTYAKVSALERRGAAGVLIVRRRSPAPGDRLGVRSAWADWQRERGLWNDLGTPHRGRRRFRIPALEVTPEVARDLLGQDAWELGREIERTGAPTVFSVAGVRIEAAGDTRSRNLPSPNVVARLIGRERGMADEYPVIGAHLDHLGVDPRGRIANGADDNASGVAGLLAVARALQAVRPARSVLFCAFAAEEHGLLGSRALLRDPPVPEDKLVAMLNMDMIGRGEPAEIVCIGTDQNPLLGELLEAAAALGPTGLERIVTDGANELWRRSDHYPFHQAGIPALFFFERVDIEENPDYHSFRDVPELVSAAKVASTARLVFLLAWLLTERDERPPSPRR